jgi:hypothetical protein
MSKLLLFSFKSSATIDKIVVVVVSEQNSSPARLLEQLLAEENLHLSSALLPFSCTRR